MPLCNRAPVPQNDRDPVLKVNHSQPGRPSCCACFSTSKSYSAAASAAVRRPDPTSTVICSSAGPLIGERNSSAGAVAPSSWKYGSRSATAGGTSAGKLQLLITYGPVAPFAADRASQPSALARNATNRFASSG